MLEWAGMRSLLDYVPLMISGHNLRNFSGLCELYYLKIFAPVCLPVQEDTCARVLCKNFYFSNSKVDFLCLVWAVCALLVLNSSADMCMSVLTQKTPHCVPCTVISVCVLNSHRVQL